MNEDQKKAIQILIDLGVCNVQALTCEFCSRCTEDENTYCNDPTQDELMWALRILQPEVFGGVEK